MIRSSRFAVALDVDEIAAHLARSLPGATGRDVDHVVRTALNRAWNRSPDRDSAQLSRDDLIAAARESRKYASG
jgi:hypothetical protein